MTKRSLPGFLVVTALICGSAIGQEITLSVGDSEAPAGGEAEVPISIAGAKNAGPLQFVLRYDPDVLTAIADPDGVEPYGVVFGDLVRAGMLEQDVIQPGHLYIRFVTNAAITSDGELLVVRFNVKGKTGDTSTISLNVPEAWDHDSLDELRVNVTPGVFSVGSGSGGSLGKIAVIGVLALLLGALIAVYLKRRQSKSESAAADDSKTETTPKSEPMEPGKSNADKLKDLKEMLDAELITQEEFDEKKKAILDQM